MKTMHVGYYELWVDPDGGSTSLFMPSVQTAASYYLLTHRLGYGEGLPEYEDDLQEDLPMQLVWRFWAPSFWSAKRLAACAERLFWWRASC